jgi:hypothetical protein
MPPVLGHAGLITNDLGAAATLVLALLALEWHLDAPSAARAALTGLVFAVGVLTKFSFLVFFPPAALIVVIVRKSFRWRDAGVAALVAMSVVWGGYKFDFGTAKELTKDGMFLYEYAAPKPFRPYTRRLAEVPLPAPALSVGLAALAFHNQQGHDAYLFGEVHREGWWYYFPVVFLQDADPISDPGGLGLCVGPKTRRDCAGRASRRDDGVDQHRRAAHPADVRASVHRCGSRDHDDLVARGVSLQSGRTPCAAGVVVRRSRIGRARHAPVV